MKIDALTTTALQFTNRTQNVAGRLGVHNVKVIDRSTSLVALAGLITLLALAAFYFLKKFKGPQKPLILFKGIIFPKTPDSDGKNLSFSDYAKMYTDCRVIRKLEEEILKKSDPTALIDAAKQLLSKQHSPYATFYITRRVKDHLLGCENQKETFMKVMKELPKLPNDDITIIYMAKDGAESINTYFSQMTDPTLAAWFVCENYKSTHDYQNPQAIHMQKAIHAFRMNQSDKFLEHFNQISDERQKEYIATELLNNYCKSKADIKMLAEVKIPMQWDFDVSDCDLDLDPISWIPPSSKAFMKFKEAINSSSLDCCQWIPDLMDGTSILPQIRGFNLKNFHQELSKHLKDKPVNLGVLKEIAKVYDEKGLKEDSATLLRFICTHEEPPPKKDLDSKPISPEIFRPIYLSYLPDFEKMVDLKTSQLTKQTLFTKILPIQNPIVRVVEAKKVIRRLIKEGKLHDVHFVSDWIICKSLQHISNDSNALIKKLSELPCPANLVNRFAFNNPTDTNRINLFDYDISIAASLIKLIDRKSDQFLIGMEYYNKIEKEADKENFAKLMGGAFLNIDQHEKEKDPKKLIELFGKLDQDIQFLVCKFLS